MIRETLRLVQEEFRPHAALNDVARIASFHRIQCSPGIRDAALCIKSQLEELGISVELMSFPAKKGVSWWSQQSFPEWEARDAELILLEDGQRTRLCSYAEFKTSLVQRSAPTPPEGLETKIVLVEDAANPKAYEGLDVVGKLVFSRGAVADIAALAVDKFGAAGIIVDTMREQPPVREYWDLPDGRQYLSFWPSDPDSHKALGFVLTPRQGQVLRRLFASGKKELSVYARVDSRFFDGQLEVLSAAIPGETEEEVVGVAHLCHPEPSANDNASGSGALVESLSALSRLIAQGRLPKPERTIRFLWVPEMTGSYAYLANHEETLKRTVAAINLDMVGENQDLCGSTFTVERPICALPGFGGDLAAAILSQMTKQTGNLGGTHKYAMFRWTVGPFSGGSDHHIWGDPSVGVTCPMLIQWPDKFYHTSEDTIDKVDPRMLAVAGVLTATYLYTAATATPADAAYIAGEMASRFGGEVDGLLSTLVQGAREKVGALSGEEVSDLAARVRRSVEKRVDFLERRKKADVESLLRLVKDSAMFSAARTAAQAQISSTAAFLKGKVLRDLAITVGLDDVAELPPAWEPEETDAARRAKNIVPLRVYRGPFSGMAREQSDEYKNKLKAFSDKYGATGRQFGHLQYWVDDCRTLDEIAHLIEGETGMWNIEALVELLDLMVMQGALIVRQ